MSAVMTKERKTKTPAPKPIKAPPNVRRERPKKAPAKVGSAARDRREAMQERRNPIIPELVGLGERIREARRRVGLTQEDLARAIGTSVQDIGQVENGWRSTSVLRVHKIARALSKPRDPVEAEWLLSGISPKAHELLRSQVNETSRSPQARGVAIVRAHVRHRKTG